MEINWMEVPISAQDISLLTTTLTRYNKKVTKLNFSAGRFDKIGISVLGDFLQKDSKINSLTLSVNGIPDEHIQIFLSKITDNFILIELNFEGCVLKKALMETAITLITRNINIRTEMIKKSRYEIIAVIADSF